MKRVASCSKHVALVAFAALAASARVASAEPPPPVDVVVREAPPPHRTLAIEWNPLPLATIGKLSANAVITPGDHHALVLCPFYAWAKTAPIWIFDDSGAPTQLPTQKIHGFGAEIGYRYYFGEGGPRGLFLGPSLILGSFVATAENGTDTSYLGLGIAADVGYQVLISDRLALSVGAGVQTMATTKSIPPQQYPAELYANNLVRPRALFSLGWAF
jgi:hypothetical protein